MSRETGDRTARLKVARTAVQHAGKGGSRSSEIGLPLFRRGAARQKGTGSRCEGGRKRFVFGGGGELNNSKVERRKCDGQNGELYSGRAKRRGKEAGLVGVAKPGGEDRITEIMTIVSTLCICHFFLGKAASWTIGALQMIWERSSRPKFAVS